MEAFYLLNDYTPIRDDLVFLSGRGGTSGIGINTYFDGGFVIDLGKKNSDDFFKPSQLNEDRTRLPLVMQRLEMPEWEIGICIPNDIPHKTEDEESEFFKETCPISSDEVYKTLYNVIYGLYSAVREKDKKTFCSAIKSIQQCAWKFSERKQYGDQLSRIEQALYRHGADAVGMSSLGPSLFFLAEDVGDVISKIRKEPLDCKLLTTKPSNRGRVING